jgi:hypothetical protein
MTPDATESPKPPKPLPYERTQREDGAEAMKSWTKTRLEKSWRYAGSCPRCNHRTEKDIPDKAIVLKLAASPAPAESDRYVVECNCGEPHTDRPDDGKGCGAFWGVEIRRGSAERDGADA